MTDSVLLDNDVILKTCCYDAIDELTACIGGNSRTLHLLGMARYVLTKAINKGKNIFNKERAADRLGRLLERVSIVEPNDDELMLAAEFEETAQSCGLDLDGGESQLLAVLIRRRAVLLATGDKRAIKAIESVVITRGYDEQAGHKVACLEQIFMALLRRYGAESLQTRICGEADVDIALTICFKCSSEAYHRQYIVDGLVSYIRDLRQYAPNVLVDSDDLSTVIPQEDGVGRF